MADPREGVYIVSGPAGFYWERKFSGPIFVEWFGAIGDDSTDNQAAYDGAIDALNYRGSGDLQWGKGVFRQSGTIAVGGGLGGLLT